MKIKFLTVSLCCLAVGFLGTLYATEVYKKIDKKGRIIYSDTPLEDAELINVQPIKTHPAPRAPRLSEETREISEKPIANISYQVTIASPEPDSFIPVGENSALTVQVFVSPQLSRSHLLQLTLDGQRYGAPQANNAFKLNNIENGTHSLQALVVDQKNSNQIVAQSPIVQIHTKRSFLENPVFPKAPQMQKAPQAPLAPRAP